MRNTTQSRNWPDNRSFEVLASIHLPKNRRIEIDRELDPLVDALAIDGSVEQIDAVFIRIYRGMKKVEVAWRTRTRNAKFAFRGIDRETARVRRVLAICSSSASP